MKRKRFFIFQSREDKLREGRLGSYMPTYKVLDRETVVDGKYKVMAEKLNYLDASGLAAKLNGKPNHFSPR